MNATQSPGWVRNAVKRCQGNTSKAMIALVLALSFLFAGVATATAGSDGTGTTVVTAGPNFQPSPSCTYDVLGGVFSVYVLRGSSTAHFTAVITNNAKTATTVFRGRLSDGQWAHAVWHTYTPKNVVRVTVSGHPCVF